MKLTKSQLKQMIKEELDNLGEQLPPEEAPAAPQGGEDERKYASGDTEKQDVGIMLKYIAKINNYQEYSQLLEAILNHNVKGKARVMRSLLGGQVANALAKKYPAS